MYLCRQEAYTKVCNPVADPPARILLPYLLTLVGKVLFTTLDTCLHTDACEACTLQRKAMVTRTGSSGILLVIHLFPLPHHPAGARSIKPRLGIVLMRGISTRRVSGEPSPPCPTRGHRGRHQPRQTGPGRTAGGGEKCVHLWHAPPASQQTAGPPFSPSLPRWLRHDVRAVSVENDGRPIA